MSKDNFDACLREILHHEGGWSNHNKDPGGMTMLGVTKQTYEDWVGHSVTEAVMRSLTPAKVAPLYQKKFWDVMCCDFLPSGLDLCVFDFGVNAGTNRSSRYLQKLVGAVQDGSIGPKTIQAVGSAVKDIGAEKLISNFQASRREFYKRLVTFQTFGRGWLRRVDEVEKTAKKMAKDAIK